MNNNDICFAIVGRDRFGIVYDIFGTFLKYKVSTKLIDSYTGITGIGAIILNFKQRSDLDLISLKNDLSSINGVLSVNIIPLEVASDFVHIKSGEAIITTDENGMITMVNYGAEILFNLNMSQAIGKDIKDIIPQSIPAKETIIKGEIYYDDDIQLPSVFSDSKHYILLIKPILSEIGKPVGAVISLEEKEMAPPSNTNDESFYTDSILGRSSSITYLKGFARTIAKSNSSVLIKGETGVGKELFARFIHNAGPRRCGPFIPVNCAAIPENLMESEFFGYEDGAFTGAKKGGKKGIFLCADKGTIFLDEIGELPLSMQAKLLRVLQDGKIRKIGGEIEIPVDVRIIAATNKDLKDLRNKGLFRDDLYYRLNVIPLEIPPLRERKDDIPILVRHFIEKYNKRANKNVKNITEEAMQKLLAYDWPGNVRELSNIIELAVNICENALIESKHIIIEEMEQNVIKHELKEHFIQAVPRPLKLKVVKENAEIDAIKRALSLDRSIRQAARALGVSHVTLIKKMKKYGIRKEDCL